MPRNIFFDLDGTLIDCRNRLYKLFTDLVPECSFTFQEYFLIKAQRMDQKTVLETYFNYSPDKIMQFKTDWLAQIESPERLAQDKVMAGVDLARFTNLVDTDTYVVTNRQFKERTIQQLKQLGLYENFTNILVTEQKNTKAQLIKSNVLSLSPGDIIIGDTGEDVLTGRELGIRTVAVQTGVLNKEILSEYKPDIIVENMEVFFEDRNLHA